MSSSIQKLINIYTVASRNVDKYTLNFTNSKLNEMSLVSGRGSTLNPNARPFIPTVYREVEDFSSEWWNLVENSAWFREYWMSENQEVNFEEIHKSKDSNDITNLLPDTFDVGYDPSLETEFEEMVESCESYDRTMLTTSMKLQNGQGLDPALMANLNMVASSPKGRGLIPSSMLEPARYNERAVQYVSPKHGPKRIHQPR